jgi:hypothetical protein
LPLTVIMFVDKKLQIYLIPHFSTHSSLQYLA